MLKGLGLMVGPSVGQDSLRRGLQLIECVQVARMIRVLGEPSG